MPSGGRFLVKETHSQVSKVTRLIKDEPAVGNKLRAGEEGIETKPHREAGDGRSGEVTSGLRGAQEGCGRQRPSGEHSRPGAQQEVGLGWTNVRSREEA